MSSLNALAVLGSAYDAHRWPSCCACVTWEYRISGHTQHLCATCLYVRATLVRHRAKQKPKDYAVHMLCTPEP
jgi:hypothetical protein